MENAKKAVNVIREHSKKRLIKNEMLTEKQVRIERCKKENFVNYQPIYIPKITDVFNSQDAKVFLEQWKKFLTAKV